MSSLFRIFFRFFPTGAALRTQNGALPSVFFGAIWNLGSNFSQKATFLRGLAPEESLKASPPNFGATEIYFWVESRARAVDFHGRQNEGSGPFNRSGLTQFEIVGFWGQSSPSTLLSRWETQLGAHPEALSDPEPGHRGLLSQLACDLHFYGMTLGL